MNRFYRAFALATLISTSPMVAFADATTVEVLHFWTTPNEVAALNVFADAYREKGGEWFDVPNQDIAAMRRTAIRRIAEEFPPTAMQWHAGLELADLLELGIIHAVDDVVDGGEAFDAILPAVRAHVDVDGNLAAVPVGVHGENWAWYNLGIYNALGLPLPDSWAEFIEQAPVIAAAGYLPLAIGNQSWQHVLLFQTVLIDVAGRDIYLKSIRNLPLSPLELDEIRKAIKVFLAVRDLVSDPSADEKADWSSVTARVIEGDAAMQVMGDWAKGAFLSAGKVLGTDFDCRLAPGNSDAFMTILDVFILAKSAQPDVILAQRAFVETVLDPENQRSFARIKGSLPTIADVDPADMDDCVRIGVSKMADPALSVPGLILAATADHTARVDMAVSKLWNADPASRAPLIESVLAEVFAR